MQDAEKLIVVSCSFYCSARNGQYLLSIATLIKVSIKPGFASVFLKIASFVGKLYNFSVREFAVFYFIVCH
jgi:hypothetical protein